MPEAEINGEKSWLTLAKLLADNADRTPRQRPFSLAATRAAGMGEVFYLLRRRERGSYIARLDPVASLTPPSVL
jgi:hypothetical protein